MVDVVQVMATLAAMVVVVGGIAAAVVAIRRWIQGLAVSAGRAEQAATRAAEQTTQQLATSNGHTIGQYVEATALAVSQLRSEIGVLTGWTAENRDLAKLAADRAERAEQLAQRTSDRLDAHLLAHGGDHG